MDIINLMYKIQSENSPPQLVYLPHAEKESLYEIDLSTRTINGPTFLSVLKDHQSETVYFKMDRYYDHMDLASTHCIIYYTTPDQNSHIYIVPFFDIETGNETLYDQNNQQYTIPKIIFPWLIDGIATSQAGSVEYCIQFFKFDQNSEELTYTLTTLPTKGQILHGLPVNDISNQEYEVVLQTDLTALVDKIRSDEEINGLNTSQMMTLRSVLEAVSNLYDSAKGLRWLDLSARRDTF